MNTRIKTTTLQLTDACLTIVRDDAIKSYPNECCGFLFGTENAGRILTLAVPLSLKKEGNPKKRPEIQDQDFAGAHRLAAELGLELLGIYTSRPERPALPSLDDLQVALPYFSYIIVSVQSGKIVDERSWRLNETLRLFEEEFVMQPLNLS